VTSDPLVMGTAAFGLAIAPAASLTSTLQFEIDPSRTTNEILRGNNNAAMTLNLYRQRSLCPDRPRRLTADARFAGDGFGNAISAYADRIVSGAKNHGYDATGGAFERDAGAAYVHLVNGTSGTSILEEKLVPTGVNARHADDLFGSAVAIAGTVVAVGAPGQDYDATGAGAVTDTGAVYLFRRSRWTWTHEAKLAAPLGHRHVGDGFGSAVALSPDGLILAVGAHLDDYDTNGLSFASSAGSVYVYRYTNGAWAFSQKIVGTGLFAFFRNAGDAFGTSVALAAGKLAIGAPGQDYDQIGNNLRVDAGAVYVFSDSGTSYTFQDKLAPLGINTRLASDNLGQSVAIYLPTSGRYTLVAGAPGQDYDAAGANFASGAGAAYVYTGELSGAFWTLRQKLTSDSGNGDRRSSDSFGKSVGVSGTRLIVGAPGQDSGSSGGSFLSGAGAIYLYQPVGTIEWSLVKKHAAAGAGTNARLASDAFGGTVAISSVLFTTGVPVHDYDDSGANLVSDAGATFVYFR
jgi:hypothetical protein